MNLKLIETAGASGYAWMIRNDGELFRMKQHIYGSLISFEETLAAAEWLYGATAKESTKNIIIEFIASWVRFVLHQESCIAETLYREIETRPYKFLTVEFVQSIADKLEGAQPSDDTDALNQIIVAELNQEFLRARYGGMYNSRPGSREMVFRVSSVGFNWFNIIYQFVYEHQHSIDSITIVKDEESLGVDTVYTHRGVKLDHTPIDDFILLPGNPVIESIKQHFTQKKPSAKLAQGQSILNSYPVSNYGRLVDRYMIDQYNYAHHTAEI